jgi:hypothetical protein|tara:strand:- start:11 stop:478 length:468 start_codon:yes stop_codon:yes gene_type:complete
MVFEQAWSIVKDVDFRIPRPSDPPAKYTEPNAVLAFHGSKIPMMHTHDKSLGIRTEAGQFEVGDFGEDMHEGKEAGSFLSYHHGLENVRDEIERASLVRALMEAGIVGEEEIESALDETSFADMRGTFHAEHFPESKRLDSGKGFMTTQIGGGDL